MRKRSAVRGETYCDKQESQHRTSRKCSGMSWSRRLRATNPPHSFSPTSAPTANKPKPPLIRCHLKCHLNCVSTAHCRTRGRLANHRKTSALALFSHWSYTLAAFVKLRSSVRVRSAAVVFCWRNEFQQACFGQVSPLQVRLVQPFFSRKL